MKYKWHNQTIPQTKRKEINDKIIYLINQNLLSKYQVTAEDIYNSYTGKGHLTDIQFKDYNNYYEFSQARKVEEQGEFFTPHNICEFVMNSLKPDNDNLICDITSGIGNFCNFVPVEENFYLNDIDLNNVKIMRQLYLNANISNNDIKVYEPNIKFDLIVGNPPYGLKFNTREGEYQSQFYYCVKAQQLLKPLGIMCIVIPNSFMNDDFTDQGIIKYMNQYFNFICQYDLPVNSFKQVGINYIETKVMIFQRKSENLEINKPYILDKINIELTKNYSDLIYNKYIKPLYNEKEKIKTKLILEMINHNNVNNEDFKQFEFKIKKLLFDIKRNPKIKQYYNKAFVLYNKYLNQKQPEGMDWKEWNKKRLTKKKVIRYIKNYLNKQHENKIDKIELVKTNYGLRLKGYSRKNKLLLNTMNCIKEISFNDMILNKEYPFTDKKYYKLYLKKLKQYENQSVKFKGMGEDREIKNFLDELTIKDYFKDEYINLNDIQKEIVNKMLQKKYGYIQAEQGSGKTLMSISYALHRKQFTNVKNIFVIAPSIAINGTWMSTLKSYKIPYIVLNKISDIQDIKQGDFILVTFNMLIKLQKYIKKYLKKISNNYVLIIDECDSICRIDSKRTKATLGTVKKARYKIALSGTMTRNNISESYTSFSLLYNSSVNFLSKNEVIFETDRETKDLKEKTNSYYLKPFPEYKKGYKLFTESFNPQKITVFGVGQNTQNIYNSEVLKELIDKTIITKTFEEVVGSKIYDIVQHTVKFNQSEQDLYYKAINEFYSMKYLFTSTGNARKDRMMEIIQQIMLLLNICQHPQTYREYQSTEIPNKYNKVLNLLSKWSNKQVAIGCRSLKEINCYSQLIQKYYPNRKLFIITGGVSISRRKEIIKELKNIKDGVLLSTQQSLSSSISIDYINKVIITALSWNYSTLSQYFFRFIRYTSEHHKEIHFITYENSLESNLLGLILAKENLTMFMKNKEVTDDELYEKFGVDFNLIDMLLCKERDSEGHVKIVNWGEQEII